MKNKRRNKTIKKSKPSFSALEFIFCGQNGKCCEKEGFWVLGEPGRFSLPQADLGEGEVVRAEPLVQQLLYITGR